MFQYIRSQVIKAVFLSRTAINLNRAFFHRKKLELLIPELTFLKEKDFSDYLQIELFQEPLIKNERIFQDINRALDEELIVELEINNHKYSVAPLSYALRPLGLYLYASDGVQLFDFPISDIVYCKITDHSFERQDYEKFKFN